MADVTENRATSNPHERDILGHRNPPHAREFRIDLSLESRARSGWDCGPVLEDLRIAIVVVVERRVPQVSGALHDELHLGIRQGGAGQVQNSRAIGVVDLRIPVEIVDIDERLAVGKAVVGTTSPALSRKRTCWASLERKRYSRQTYGRRTVHTTTLLRAFGYSAVSTARMRTSVTLRSRRPPVIFRRLPCMRVRTALRQAESYSRPSIVPLPRT
jgi:hypothetical protein